MAMKIQDFPDNCGHHDQACWSTSMRELHEVSRYDTHPPFSPQNQCHTAFSSNPYSWCKPPRIGQATTRRCVGSRCWCTCEATGRCKSGCGMPGLNALPCHDNEFHELSPNPLVSGFLGATMRGLGGWGRRNPARDACGKLVGAQRAAERLQAILRPMPLEVKGALLERHIPAKRRQAAIQQHICVMSPETFGQPERPGTSQTPSARVVGNGLEVFVTGQHRGRRLWPVLSQSCFFESFGICKSLNLREPIFGFYP
jgi:hypothetical protein